MGDHAGRRSLVGLAVDEDEGAGHAIGLVGVEGDRRRRRDIAEADLVELQALCSELVVGVDVDAMLELGHLRRHGSRADLHQIRAARQHRVGAHPDEMRGELIGDLRAAGGMRKHVATRDVDLVFERQRHGVAGFRGLPLLVSDKYGFDSSPLARPGDNDRLAARHSPAWNRAHEAAKIEVRPIDPLYRQAEGGAPAVLVDLDGFELLQEMAALIPGRPLAHRRDIVAEPRRNGNREQGAEAERLGELAVVDDDVTEDALVIAHEVDLVDREHDMADAEQRDDDRMAMGLGEQTLSRVDEHDREIGVGCAGRHVAGILLVSGRVGDDERAPRGRKVAVGDVDGDALLALGFEAVDEESEVDRILGRAEFLRSRARAPAAGRRRSASARTAIARSASTCRRRPIRRSTDAGWGVRKRDPGRSRANSVSCHSRESGGPEAPRVGGRRRR